MALNLDSNQIFEITRYHNISNKNQYFYAVKENILYDMDNPKPLKTILKTIFKGGYFIRDNMVGDSNDHWVLVETSNGNIIESLDSSIDSSEIKLVKTWINWVNPTDIPERTIKISADSLNEQDLISASEEPQVIADSDWAEFEPDLNERDSLNSSAIQDILTEFEGRVHLNPFYAVFLDSSGQHWDDDTQQWLAGPDPSE